MITTYDPDLVPMAGSKSGKGGGASTGAKEAPNTLQSKTIIKIMEILGEGPINRLVGSQPGQAVIMDPTNASATPLMGPDGQWNYKGATIDVRLGEPSQKPMPGFDDQVTVVQVGVPVRNNGDPIGNAVVRRVNALDADAVRVVMQVEALINIDTKTGDQNGYSVEYSIDVRQRADQSGSGFVEKVHDRITGKTTSAWQQAYRIPLEGTGPWDIRVRRISADDSSSSKQSSTSWALLEQITEYPLSYPYTAYVGLTADTSQFGTSVPTRGYLVEGLIVQVPSNYNAQTRTYSGIWDGTFTSAYTNCPAWVLWDLLSNNRYGLGDLFTSQRMSLTKWDLYAIAKYADANNSRPGGTTDDYSATGKHGVPDGNGGWEPRFTFNAVINTKEKAYECIAAICGMMRSAMLWAGGQPRLMQDRPMKPVKIFSPANVIDGLFNYTGSALRARHTAVRVLWQNPNKGWDVDDVVIEDPDMIQRYGYNLKEETAYGCTSYGQALRHARNILVTERMETDSVQFAIGPGEIDILPGQVFEIADPSMTQADWAGRVTQHTLSSVTFDRDIQFDPARTYTLTVVLADGTLKDTLITNPGGLARTVNIAVAFDPNNRPVLNAMYAISSDTLALRTFRLLTIETTGDGTFKMSALQYAPGKYGEIETGLKAAPPLYSDLPPTDVVQPPSNLRLTYASVESATGSVGTIEIEWDPSGDQYLAGYYVEYQYGFDDWVRLPLQKGITVRLVNPKIGPVRVRVTAINMGGLASKSITNDIDLSTGGAAGKAPVYGLNTQSNDGQWTGRDIVLLWSASPIYGNGTLQSAGQDQFFKQFRLRVMTPDGATQLGVFYTTSTSFTITYDQLVAMGVSRSYRVAVALQDINDVFSAEAVNVISNPAPGLLVPIIDAKPNSVTLKFAPNIDADFEGMIVWIGTTPDFVASDATKYWKAKGNPVIPVTPKQTLYLRYAPYDAFGELGLNISAVQTIAVPDFLIGGMNAQDIVDSLRIDTQSIVEQALRLDQAQQVMSAIGYVNGQTVANFSLSFTNQWTGQNAAINSKLDLLGARNSDGTAWIMDLNTVQVGGGKTLAQKFSEVGYDDGTIKATIQTLQQIQAQQDGVISGFDSKVNDAIKKVGDMGGVVAGLGDKVTGLSTKVAATYTLAITQGGYVSGFRLANDGQVSSMVILADRFAIVSQDGDTPVIPMQIVGGTVYMDKLVATTISYNSLVQRFSDVGQQNLDPSGWYQVLPGGIIMQGGRLRRTINGDQTIYVAFPRPFPNQVLAVGANAFLSSFSKYADLIVQNVGEPSTTGTTFQAQATGSDTAPLQGIDWWAWGK